MISNATLRDLFSKTKKLHLSAEGAAALANLSVIEEDDEEEAESMEESEEVSTPKRGNKRREKSSIYLDELSEYVPITKLIPPLPSKGDFDVNVIRQSPYFFS